MGKEYNLDKELVEGHRTAERQRSNTLTTTDDVITHKRNATTDQRQEYSNMIWDTESRY